MNSVEINTSQNVKLKFEIAGIGSRMMAFIIDMLIKLAYLIVMWMVWTKFFNFNTLSKNIGNWEIMAIIGMITMPINFYSLAFESLMEGQTPGKMLMKIKVIQIDGYQAHFSSYLSRWFFRLVDIMVGAGIIGFIAILVDKYNRRLGDMVAGTAVISLKNRFNINHTILVNLEEDYVPRFPQVIALSDDDIRIVKDNLQRYSAQKNGEVMAKLSSKIKEITQISYDPEEFTDKAFIYKVIQDYNFYSSK
ncbi:RDD family protein [Elizabethkingia sp. JS20170427COW]|uniref:RDD family protein n=1 Tax=Elizabethkingia sp. JS20170427COW TaxID=2583851 RepID=UPI001110F1A4|nr:RDD family protein [Elizabethkingia sp. JS20170427COW]QCX53515.1 RDD family protein [Elizabethkingia sp. JS20170427COW]